MADKDYKTTIKIDGDAKGANGAIDQVRSNLQGGLIGALGKVRLAMASISRALGVFWLAWNGVQLVVSGWRKLTEVMTAAQRKVAEIHFSRIFNEAAQAADRLIGKHKEINAQLERMARNQSLVRDVREIAAAAQRDADSSRREVERAGLLAGVTDPRQRQQLQDRFAAEDEQIKAADAKREREEKVAALREEAGIRRRIVEEQSALRQQTEEELKRQREQLDILERWKKPDADRIDAVKQRIAALERERKAAIEAANAAREAADAASLQANAYEAAATYSGPTARAIASEAAWTQMDAADRQSNEAFTQQLAENEMRSARDRQFATLDDAGKVQELNRRETEARERMTAAQGELADEMAKDVKDRSEERITRARAAIETAQAEALSAASQREELERGMDAAENARRESLADGISAQFTQGGNRLTAMGLGSGADGMRPVEEINGKVSTILDVLRQTVEAVRNIENGGETATFGA